jgi:predicted dehydrogenase
MRRRGLTGGALRRAQAQTVPRIGFLGLGWIGLDRLRAIAASGVVDIAVVADPDPRAQAGARGVAPGAEAAGTLGEVLVAAPDGVVIATPNALHAAQAIAALTGGAAVFCQKPLGLDAAQTATVVAAARKADRLLSVDMSYRHTAAARALREAVRDGGLGRIHAIDLTFHNAYGPDKPWYRDPELAGGGCLIDLGVHLVDLALWLLDTPDVEVVEAQLFRDGGPVRPGELEDRAAATLRTADGTRIRIDCSWWAQAGADAVFAAEVHGTTGGARMGNVAGSFYDFAAFRHRGTAAEQIAAPPDPWGGRAAVAWAARVAAGERFDRAEAEGLLALSRVIDAIYAQGRAGV